MGSKLKNYLHLHFIVFIWGFTAVLGKLITIDALPLVWYRMLIGTVLIKVSNVSIALATISTGAFFTAIIEPIWYKRKVIWYEIVFGVIVILGLLIIFNVETNYVYGILLALLSAFLAAIFSLMNGKLVQKENPAVISFYELGFGVVFLSIYLLIKGGFNESFFQLALNDWVYIAILASICTAYAFIASVDVMKYISPYTVMLTINLEPVYGIVLAFIIFGNSEQMNPLFYLGAAIILATVIANGILKNKGRLKK